MVQNTEVTQVEFESPDLLEISAILGGPKVCHVQHMYNTRPNPNTRGFRGLGRNLG